MRSLRPDALRLSGHVVVGLGFAVVVYLIHNPTFYYLVWTYFLIIGDSLFQRPGAREIRENFRWAVATFLFGLLVVPVARAAEVYLTPHTLDGFLRECDLWLRLDGFAWTRLCWRSRFACAFLVVVYNSLPVALGAAWIVGRRIALWRGCLIGGILAFFIYLMCPAVGPHRAFQNWPAVTATLLSSVPPDPRNCVPSMHFAWTLLAAANVPGKWRWLFGAFAVLTALAAVAVGEHYFVDMLPAIPVAVVIQHLSTERPSRRA